VSADILFSFCNLLLHSAGQGAAAHGDSATPWACHRERARAGAGPPLLDVACAEQPAGRIWALGGAARGPAPPRPAPPPLRRPIAVDRGSSFFYSSGMQRRKCNISTHTSPKQHVLALGLCAV
jgi:hypothetical protein